MKKYFMKLMIVLLFVIMVSQSWAFTDEEKNNIDIYKKASSGVVNITTVVLERDFFMGIVPREGSGSGFIVDTNGHIVTNNHVIKDARQIEVTLSSGKKLPGRLIGTDPGNDLAIVKIEIPSSELNPLQLGDSDDLQVGQKVLAIGNPFGLNETLTTGIISSIGRSIRSEEGMMMEDLIQTDAAINPGNSGGPLLDSTGRVIGINTAIFSPSGGSVGIGFAIAVDTAKQIIPDLIAKGRISYPWLGVNLYPLLPGIARALRLDVERGALIVEVIPDSPAQRAGLRGANQLVRLGNSTIPAGGDVIVAFNGQPVNSSEEFLRLLRKHRANDKVKLNILRNGRFMDVTVTIGERPRDY
ncbi:MAG TPA: trypsin-like peptidase domain-containing protein [Thermodesulfovibrionia bacterium]|nr:trypsin-like peptidase domain-containing protein [Thermodesulfovibrionia bacterium]